MRAPAPSIPHRVRLPGLALASGLALLLLGVAPPARAGDPEPPARINPDTPASDAPASNSIWDYIEPATPTEANLVKQATEELAEERLAELSRIGELGAPAPIEYYLDPVSATERDPLHLEKIDPEEFDIPITVNDMVKGWMEYFLGRGRKYYARYLERSTHWIPMMHAQIDARGDGFADVLQHRLHTAPARRIVLAHMQHARHRTAPPGASQRSARSQARQTPQQE